MLSLDPPYLQPLLKKAGVQVRPKHEQVSRSSSFVRHDKLQEFAREQSSIEDLVNKYGEYKATIKGIKETELMLDGDLDDDMADLAKEELDNLKEQRERLMQEMKVSLLPSDPADMKNVIVEIRAGSGGEEAGLFAADLFRMYARYAADKGWNTEILSSNETGIGGF